MLFFYLSLSNNELTRNLYSRFWTPPWQYIQKQRRDNMRQCSPQNKGLLSVPETIQKCESYKHSMLHVWLDKKRWVKRNRNMPVMRRDSWVSINKTPRNTKQAKWTQYPRGEERRSTIMLWHRCKKKWSALNQVRLLLEHPLTMTSIIRVHAAL